MAVHLEMWSDNECASLMYYRDSGLTWGEIGKKIGRTEEGCKRKYYRLGLAKMEVSRWTAGQEESLRRFVLMGYSVPAISKKLNRTTNAIYGKLHRMNIRVGG